MSKDDKAEKRHRGIAVFESENAYDVVALEPHYKHECEEKCAEAREKVKTSSEPETLFESADYGSSTSVGYSRAYADKYDAVFGKRAN